MLRHSRKHAAHVGAAAGQADPRRVARGRGGSGGYRGEKALDALKAPNNKSGYEQVRGPSKGSKVNPYQALAYIKHGDQRNLGSFPTARAAARQIFYFMIGFVDGPPTPGNKDRAKRGEGPHKRDRRKGARRLSPPQPAPPLTALSLARRWPGLAHQRVNCLFVNITC